MSTYYLRPVADGATLQLTPTPSGSHYTTVDEAVADDADYLAVTVSTTWKTDILTLGTLSVPASEMIVSATVKARIKQQDSTGGTVYFSVFGVEKSFSPTTSWAEVSFALNWDKVKHAIWQAADLSGKSITIMLYTNNGAFPVLLSQLYVEVLTASVGTNSVILRPNGDKLAPSVSVYPASPATAYDKVDETTKDTGDYLYKENGAGGSAQLDFGTASIIGTIHAVVAHVYVQSTSTGSSTMGVVVNGSTVETDTFANTTEWHVTRIQSIDPTTGVAFAAGDLGSIYAKVSIVAPSGAGQSIKVYQVWLEVFYTPLVYMDSISALPASSGYAQIGGILKAGVPTINKKRAQIADESTFASPLADSTELSATEGAGDTVTIIVSWTPSTAGTYYARLGVQASGDASMTWVIVVFVVHFPVISSVAATHLNGSLYRITVVVIDEYADPPDVSVTIDGQTSLARLM